MLVLKPNEKWIQNTCVCDEYKKKQFFIPKFKMLNMNTQFTHGHPGG